MMMNVKLRMMMIMINSAINSWDIINHIKSEMYELKNEIVP